ncbi:hypothetical protein JF558_09380 [Staphylococcus hominis]|uniref:hypothetical protein n=1 Tax=Staphylococcus hominis TaxID=1290 RepID=UPI0018ED5D8C|nr:hypothetical protein [Staphylococcus hominis]MBJ6366113.1 hypothetical protein [Staphylococcus hominis]
MSNKVKREIIMAVVFVVFIICIIFVPFLNTTVSVLMLMSLVFIDQFIVRRIYPDDK